MMTQRENLLALLRRQPYEFQPVEFVFCPHLQDVLREKTGDPNADYRSTSASPGGHSAGSGRSYHRPLPAVSRPPG